MQIDLGAYLARIRIDAAPAADAEGLAAVQRAHRLAIPFENLDILLGRGIAIDEAAVFDKLVTRGRGGYCFEQDALFGAALLALGFERRPLLARVWLGAEGVPPKTHTLSLVTIEGEPWIADAGFGGTYTPPMPLAEGLIHETADGARHRLRRDGDFGWMVERQGHAALTDGRVPGRATAEGWLPQYSFTLDPVYPADLMLANHWASTAPGTRFTSQPIVSVVLPRGFASLTGRSYSRRNGDQGSEGEIESARAWRMRLGMLFGVHLTEDEVAGLELF